MTTIQHVRSSPIHSKRRRCLQGGKLGRKTDDEPGVHVERNLTDIKLLDRCRVRVETEVDGREAVASPVSAGITPPRDSTRLAPRRYTSSSRATLNRA